MEVWILLAAAGSGYLARRWQNAQKVRGTSSDEIDPHDNSTYSSSQPPSARGRYRHFSSASRRQGGKSLCGKRTHQWGRSSYKNVQVSESIAIQNAAERKSEEIVDIDDRKPDISGEIHAVSNDSNIPSGCKLASSSVVDKSTDFSEQLTAGCIVHSVLGNEISKTASEHSRVQDETTAQPLAECDGSTCVEDKNEVGKWNVRNVTERDQAADGRGLGGTDTFSRSSSAKRLNEGRNDNNLKSGCFLEDGYSGKRMKDASESMVRQEEPFECGGTWMPGCWDVSEGVFILDAASLLVQQESETRHKGNSTRKVKTPNKYGRSRGSLCRRKNLTAQKPMSSLESCLSAQLDENHKYRKTDDFVLPSSSPPGDEGEQTAGPRGISSDETSSGGVESLKMSTEGKVNVESVIGLPSLSRQPSRTSFKTLKENKCSTGRAKAVPLLNHFEGNRSVSHVTAPPGTSAGWGSSGTKHEMKVQCSNELSRERSCPKGVVGSSDGLLFNFGVGVGMMFTIMSNKREVKKLTKLLREAECLIRDLEAELQGRDGLGLEYGSSCNNVEEDYTLEQRHSVLSSTLKKARSASHSLNGTRVSLTDESEPVSGIEVEPSEDISQLEAELEAELERMALNLNDGNISKHRKRYSSSSELDLDISVQGELIAEGLPCEIEVESEIEDDDDSPHEDLQVSNHVVSPRKLAKRLHEVLEARLEERIAELEADLKLMGSKLQSQGEELQWWKDQTLCCTEGDEGVSFSKLYDESDNNFETSFDTKESAERQVLSSLQVEEEQLSSPGGSGSPNAYPGLPGISGGFSSQDLKNVPSMSPLKFQKVPKTKKNPVFITLAGDALAAYNEACDEFSKVFSDSDVGADLSSNGGTGKCALPENSPIQKADLLTAKDCDVGLMRSGSSDLWEQVDLLSLAEDFYIDGNSEFMVQMSEFCKVPPKGRKFSGRNSSKKYMMSSHPEPEQSLAVSKGLDSSDDATNDTSGSTPCSVKFIDGSTNCFCDADDQLKSKLETGASGSKSPYSDWSEEGCLHAGANTPVVSCQEGQHSPYCNKSFDINSSDSPGRGEVASTPGDWMLPEDSDHTSDLDEQLGQLLIKRIVEKSRRGSPILQDVQTALNSFERSETSLAKDTTAVESAPKEKLDSQSNLMDEEIVSPNVCSPSISAIFGERHF